MYYAYGLSIVAGAPVAVAAWVSGWSPFAISVATTVAVAAASPLSFRFSRVLWLHMDQTFDPR